MTAFADTVLSDLPLSTRLQDFLRPRGWRADFSSVVLPQAAGPQESATTPQPPSAAARTAAAGEPGPAQASSDPPAGTSAEPDAGPGGTSQTSAPGAAQEVTEPAIPPAGGGQPEAAPGAETGDEVTREEIEAEFGPGAETRSDENEASGAQDAPAEGEAEAGK